MGGGLLQLVSYGKEDEILISDPQITFFKSVYHKYTNFSIDTLNTIHQIKYNSSINIPIPKTGELLYKLFIRLDLPAVSAIYDKTIIHKLFEFVSNIYYNYTMQLYSMNMGSLFCLNNLYVGELNKFYSNYNIIQFLTYFDENGSIVKLYNILESANTLIFDLRSNVDAILSTYYNDRQIMKNKSTILTNNYIIRDNNFNNEFNYKLLTDQSYYTLYNLNLKSQMCMINLNSKFESSIVNRLFNYNQQLHLINKSYMIATSFVYYNNFKNKLLYQTMPDEYFRQSYMMLKYGYNYIDDLMINLNVNGQLIFYNDYLNNIPNYLIFVDKLNPSILVPIMITNIYKYVPDIYIISTASYYSYTGYIANTKLMDNLIQYSNQLGLDQYIIFNQVLFYTDDGRYQELDLKLKIYTIICSKSDDNLSFLYTIYIKLDNNQQILNIIKNLKYLIYIANNEDRINYMNTITNTHIDIPPIALLLIDQTDPITIYDAGNNILKINCKNTTDAYDITNLKILSPYIPILTESNTFFNLISESTNTDYKLQVEYLIANNLDTTNAKETISTYPKLLYNIFNTFLNTTNLTLKNTINNDLTLNLDIQFNKIQLANYKSLLNISSTINNTLLDHTNTHFNNYLNNLINSYSYISTTTTNATIFSEILNIYSIVNSFKSQLSSLSYINSFDYTTIFSLIYNINSEILPILTYNDIVLIKIANTLMDTTTNDKFYKVRFYPYFIDENITNINTTTNILLNDSQINYLQPNAQLFTDIIINYNNVNYIITYTYTIIHIISKTSAYIDAYVNIVYSFYKNNILQLESEYDIINTILINNYLSFVPSISNTKYILYSATDTNISFNLLYSDEYPDTTGDITINSPYTIVNYYLFKSLTSSNLEDIWFIQQNYSNIYDIISFPNYYYGKFNYDKSIDQPIITNKNIFLHDIFIIILYNAYKTLLAKNNNIISNITSLIIQEISINISSYFKDQSINLNNITSNYELSTTSLETTSLNSNAYTSFSTTNYNLINILSNSLYLSIDHILNTSTSLISKYDSQLLLFIESNIIFNPNNITNILNRYLNISTTNIYFNTNLFLKYLNLSTSPNNILKYILTLGQYNLNLHYNNPNNYILESKLSTTIINNIIIYNNPLNNIIIDINTINKNAIYNIIFGFSINNPESYDYTNLILNKISSITGIYSNNMTYQQIFNIINEAIKNYIIIYLLRSTVLDNNYSSAGIVSKTYIINLLTNQISDYTQSINIMNTLLFLQKYNYITTEIYYQILNSIININSYSAYIQLVGDPFTSDGYYIKNALSFYTGSTLLNSIRQTSIYPTFYIYESSIDDNKTKLITLLTTLSNYKTIPNYTNDMYYIQQTLLNQINTIYSNSLTYQQLYTLINNAIKEYILIYLYRSNVLNNCIGYSSLDIIINKFINSLVDYTNFQNIQNAFNYLYIYMYDNTFPLITYYNYLRIPNDLLNGVLNITDPLISDGYSTTNGLSFINGSLLIKLINSTFNNTTNQILIPKESVITNINKLLPVSINIQNYYINNLYTTTKTKTNIYSIIDIINSDEYRLSRYTNKNIINNLELYNYKIKYNLINKQSLLSILNNFKQFLINTHIDTFDIQDLFIDHIYTTYNNSIKYIDIYNIINSGIKNYLIIYLIRNKQYSNTIINIILEQIIDYTNSINIINTLNYLYLNQLITLADCNTIKLDILNIKEYTDIIPLLPDPPTTDDYLKINALSYYSGKLLLNLITNNDEFTIYNTSNKINLVNKQILIEILNSFILDIKLNPFESYDITNLIINLIKDSGIYSSVLYFSDLFNILNTATSVFISLLLNQTYGIRNNTIVNNLDYIQVVNYLYVNNLTMFYHRSIYYGVQNAITPDLIYGNKIYNYPENTSALSYYRSNLLLYKIYSSNLILYDNSNYLIKNNLLNILYSSIITNPENYDYTNLFIKLIDNSNGIFYEKIVYNDIYTIINNAIMNYISIYIYRYDFSPYSTMYTIIYNEFIYKMKILYNDYTNITSIMESIDSVIYSRYDLVDDTAKDDAINTFYNTLINIQDYSSVIILDPDPSLPTPEGYSVNNALSPFSGLMLLNKIFKKNIVKISESSFSNYLLNIPLTPNDINIDYNLITSSICDTNLSTIQSIIDTNITSSNIYNILTQQSINNIIDNIIVYDPNNDIYNLKNRLENIAINLIDISTILTNNEIMTYGQIINIVSEMNRRFIQLVLYRDTILDTLNITKQNFIYLLMDKIIDFTNYNNIIKSLNYLEQNNIITNSINIQINMLFITANLIDYSSGKATDNYTNQQILNLYESYGYLKFIFGYVDDSILTTYIYNDNDTNKIKLLNILNNFKQNLSINTVENYDIDNYLITQINSGTLYNYNDIYTIINNAIKQYFIIYLIRSNTIEYTESDITYILDNDTNYTDNINLISQINGISSSTYNVLMKLILKLTPAESYSEIIPLSLDPIVSDGYFIKDALSYFRGVKLLNEIKYKIAINSNNIFKVSKLYLMTGSNDLTGTINYNNLYINNYLSPNDLINSETILNTIYNSIIYIDNDTNNYGTSIYNIINELNNINNITPLIDPIIITNINNDINMLNFDTQITVLNNKNIKLISVDDSNTINITQTFINGVDNYISNNINNLSNYTVEYNFINELLNTNIYLTNSTIINTIINLYLEYKNASIFTTNYMLSIVNLCNNGSINIINDFIDNLKTVLINSTNSSSIDSTGYIFKYNNLIDYNDLTYNDKIYYIYNYIISGFYDNNIVFETTYTNSKTYTDYTIFINNVDSTIDLDFNSETPELVKVGPTLGPIYIKSTLTDYNTYYYVSVMLKNINALFNYFSRIVSDPVIQTGPYIYSDFNNFGSIFQAYNNNDIGFDPIIGLLIYIQKYSIKFGSTIEPTIINSNPITQIIYQNINYFVILLIHISNNYSLADLVNNTYSTINSQTYYLSTSNITNTTYTTITMPNISTYKDSSYLTELSTKDFNNYLKGVIQYNINNSIYSDFSLFINEQRLNYTTLYTDLFNLDSIGINSQAYYNYYQSYLSFNFNNTLDITKYLKPISIIDDLDINTTNFKTIYSYVYNLRLNKLSDMFSNILTYLKNNILIYNKSISDINFIEIKIDYETYISDIYNFYKYIRKLYINNVDTPNSYVLKIFENLLKKYMTHDITILYSNIYNEVVFKDDIFNIILKKAFINLNIAQITDLHNFNYYLSNNESDTNLLTDFNNIIRLDYTGLNSGNKYSILKIDQVSLVINNYCGNFFTTKLININELSNALIMQQNTLISEKILDAYNAFNMLAQVEKENIINIYNDIPTINAYLFYLYQTLSINQINARSNISYFDINESYVYYDIIMTTNEYSQISSGTYDFKNGSIAILIYDTLTNTKITTIPQPLDKTALDYTFKLYRKTDLPPEYKYIFNDLTINIGLKSTLDDLFIDIYHQISIFNDTNLLQNINHTNQINMTGSTGSTGSTITIPNINNDEKSYIIAKDLCIFGSTGSTDSTGTTDTIYTTIYIDKILLTESHKLIKMNSDISSTIYRVKSVINQTKHININYPYELRHLIYSIEINSNMYLSTDLIFNPNTVDILPLYKNSNITQISLIDDSYITINKDYINSYVKIYFNVLTGTNIELNYYIQNDQTYTNARIVGINLDNYYSLVVLHDEIVDNDIINIEFGLYNLLSNYFNNQLIDLRSIIVYNKLNYSLYNILEYFNIYEVLDGLLNSLTISNNLNQSILNNKNSFRLLRQPLNINEYLNQSIQSITYTEFNNYTNVRSKQFINIYPDLTNNINYK